MNIIIMKRTLKDFKDIITHTFLLQTQDITVIVFCFFHSCVSTMSTWMKTMFLSIWSSQPLPIIDVPPCKAYTQVFPLNCALGRERRPPSSEATTEWTQQHIFYVTENIVLCLYSISISGPTVPLLLLLLLFIDVPDWEASPFEFSVISAPFLNLLFWCRKRFQCVKCFKV